MHRFLSLMAFCLLALLLQAAVPAANAHKLTIRFTDLRVDKGIILIIVFNQPEGFPGEPTKGYRILKGDVVNKQALVVLDNMPVGTYAVACVHDENINGKLDTNMVGIPKEGYGASNDASRPFGPPTFDQAKFDLKGDREIVIKIKYLL